MATIVNNAPRIVSLNGGEHNGHAPGGVTLLPNSPPVETSDDLDEVLRTDKTFRALVASGQITDLDRTFGIDRAPVRVSAPKPAPAEPEIVDPPAMTMSTATEIAIPSPSAQAVEDASSDVEEPAADLAVDPFDGFAKAVTPAELAALPEADALAHVNAAEALDTLKAFWTADTRPAMRKAIEARARALKAAPANA